MIAWRRRRSQNVDTQEDPEVARQDGKRRLDETLARRPKVERAGDQLSYIVEQALRGGT